MFNEILTGKASLEPRPPVGGLPQEPAPDVTLSCQRCLTAYTAKAGSRSTHCGPCNTTIVQQNMAASAAAIREAEHGFRKAEASHAFMKTLIVIGVALMLGFIRYQMRKQQREDSARAAGYSSYNDYQSESAKVYPTDEFSYHVNSLADDMCRCRDLQCGRTVLAQYSRYVRTNSPSDSSARDSAEQDAQRLGDCQQSLEAGSFSKP